MRGLRWKTLGLAAVAALATACGTTATGITLSIDPDPVQAFRQADGSYVADWDAVVADLTGVGGTVESVEATLSGATLIPDARTNQGVSLQPTSMAVDAFGRRLFHEAAHFTVTAGAVSVSVSVQFRDGNGQTFQSAAQARVNLR
jgi:hypothetical protein